MAIAGYFPSIVVYFTLWYPKRDQTMRLAFLFGAAIIASVFGGILVSTRLFHKIYNTYYYSRHMVSNTWMVFVA